MQPAWKKNWCAFDNYEALHMHFSTIAHAGQRSPSPQAVSPPFFFFAFPLFFLRLEGLTLLSYGLKTWPTLSITPPVAWGLSWGPFRTCLLLSFEGIYIWRVFSSRMHGYKRVLWRDPHDFQRTGEFLVLCGCMTKRPASQKPPTAFEKKGRFSAGKMCRML